MSDLAHLLTEKHTGTGHVAEIYTKFRDVVRHLALTLTALVHLLNALIRPTLTFLQPFITRFARFVWRHFSAQSWRTIAIQTLLAQFCVVLVIAEKRYSVFSKSYHSATRTVRVWQDALRTKSKLAAAALPHLLFIALVGTVEYFLWGRAPRYLRSILLTFVTRVKPAYHSVQLLTRKETNRVKYDSNGMRNGRSRRPRTGYSEVEDQMKKQLDEDTLLSYWVVLAFVLGIRQIIYFFCPQIFTTFLTRVDVVSFYLAIWLRNSATDGKSLGFSILSAIMGRRFESRTENSRAQVGVILSVFVTLGVLSTVRAEQISTTLAESGFALFGLLFLITPAFLTFFGTVLIGWFAPAYLNLSPHTTMTKRHKWLTYFAVFSIGDCVFEYATRPLAWLPILYHVKLVGILWLQLPFYQGGKVIVDYVATHFSSTFTPHISKVLSISRIQQSTSTSTHNISTHAKTD